MSKQPLLKVSLNKTGVNKSVDFAEEQGGWITASLTPQELLDHIYRGKPSNPCLLQDGHRSAATSYGGNTVYIDMDDGVAFDLVINTPIVKQFGALVTHSSSSGVVTEKEGVDGRERLRIIFLLEEEVHTDFFSDDEKDLANNVKIQHLERCSLINYFADQLCEQLGIVKMIDNSHKSISQLFYGNDGVSPVEWKRNIEGGGKVQEFYPCSTDRRFWIGEGFLPKEDQCRIVEAYRLRKAEDLKLFVGKTDEELSQDALIAKWIFDNDVIDDRICEDRADFNSVIMAAKSIDECLLDPLLRTLERFADHYWRMPYEVQRCFHSFHHNAQTTLGTLMHWATESCPDWRSRCPYTGGMHNPPPPLSPGMYLLRGINQSNIII